MQTRRPGARRPFEGRRVVLGVTGGIAAYKAVQVARDLTLFGAHVDVVLTGGALQFLTPLSFEALTGRSVYAEPWETGDPLRHIRLAREADLVAVAPATADFLARAAAGQADDLLTAVLLATTAPVVLFPAMNDRMYAHPATRANLERLASYGYALAGPASGPLAWGEGEGLGRMIAPEEIVDHCARRLEAAGPLQGRRVLVTAGPTREPIDPVRFIGNRSSGRMGFALAASAWRRGAQVTLVTGPTPLPPPTGVEVVDVETAAEMAEAVDARMPDAQVVLMAAAIADFRPARSAPEKIKKESGPPAIELEPTADVLRDTVGRRRAGALIVGFALETENALENARGKLRGKQLDMVVLNDATDPEAAFEVETNRVTILQPNAEPEALPVLHKDEVADAILDRIEWRLAADSAKQ